MTTAEEIKELFELTTQRVAKIEIESAREIAQIRKEAEDNRKIAKELADEDFREMREILDRTEKNIEKTSSHLGFYTDSVADISEEYFYRGLKSNVTIGDMAFDTIVRNIDIDGKEYDIILENDKAVMLVSVKTNINSKHIKRLVNNDIVRLKNSSKYRSIDKKFYVTIAGFTGASRVLNLAKEKGVLILTLSGEHQPTLINPEVFPMSY